MSAREVEAHTYARYPGTYVLRDTPGGPARYVGRSDGDVRARLLQHVREARHRFFTVEHKKDPVTAWHREAFLYHHHRSTLRNLAHPNPPRGYTCPKCNMFH